MRPHDLLGRRHPARRLGVRPFRARAAAATDSRNSRRPDGEDAAAAPDLLLLRRERDGLVGAAQRLVREPARARIEGEDVAVLRVGDGLRTLNDVQAEVERVAPEDVAHVVPADDDELEPDFLGDALQSRGAHLARGSDREAVAGDDERLARMHALAKVGEEVAEGAFLPPLVERVEALGDAVGRRGDLVGVDRVELAARCLGVPEDERPAADETARVRRGEVGGPRSGESRRASRRASVGLSGSYASPSFFQRIRRDGPSRHGGGG